MAANKIESLHLATFMFFQIHGIESDRSQEVFVEQLPCPSSRYDLAAACFSCLLRLGASDSSRPKVTFYLRQATQHVL